MKKTVICILVMFFALSGFLFGQENDSAKSKPIYEMKQYFMVLLKSGTNRSQDSADVAKIQAGHMAHIAKMAEEGVLDIAGPFADKGDLRGIFILNVSTFEEAEAWCKKDPAVISERLSYEIKPWWSAKNSCLK
ncbi:MAG TPA: YciI family protein [Ignavibacteriaceae bacterium]|nr:YciI family protein [Ignavibacteriaceae bacterium]